MVTGEDVGREAADIIKRIQAGEPAQEMLPEPVRPKIVLDETTLARFGMSTPQRAILINPVEKSGESGAIASTSTIGWTVGVLAFIALYVGLRRYRQ